ncbi:hypothetical protein Vretimale_14582, partial [Volvox reticuliferus]
MGTIAPGCRTVVLCPEGDAGLFTGEDWANDDDDDPDGQRTAGLNILKPQTEIVGGIRVPRFVQILSNLALREAVREGGAGAGFRPIGRDAVQTGRLRRDKGNGRNVSQVQQQQQQQLQQLQQLQQQGKLSMTTASSGGLSLHGVEGGDAHPRRMVPELLVRGNMLQPGLDAVLLPAIQLPRNARSRPTAGFVPLLLEVNGVLQQRNLAIEEGLSGKKDQAAVHGTATGSSQPGASGGSSVTAAAMAAGPVVVVGGSDEGCKGVDGRGSGRGGGCSKRGRSRPGRDRGGGRGRSSGGGDTYGISSTRQYVYVQPLRDGGECAAVRKVSASAAGVASPLPPPPPTCCPCAAVAAPTADVAAEVAARFAMQRDRILPPTLNDGAARRHQRTQIDENVSGDMGRKIPLHAATATAAIGGKKAVGNATVWHDGATGNFSPSGAATRGQRTDPRVSLVPAGDDCRPRHWDAGSLPTIVSASLPRATVDVTLGDAKTGTSAQTNYGQTYSRSGLQINSTVQRTENCTISGVALDGPPTHPRVIACVRDRPSRCEPSGIRPSATGYGILQLSTDDSQKCTANTISTAVEAQISGPQTLYAVPSALDALASPDALAPSPATLPLTPSNEPSTTQSPYDGGRQ